MGVVIHKQGKLIQQMGISHKSVHYLYPEEVCFLLERNAAELTMNEESVDCDTFHENYLRKLVNETYYIVYRELRMFDFKVYRMQQFLAFPAVVADSPDTFVWGVYSPSHLVSKSSYTKPDYVVRVFLYQDPVPSHVDCLHYLDIADQIPVLFAVVDETKEVSFFRMDELFSRESIASAAFVK